MSRWSARHSWVERAAAFDQHEDHIRQQAVIEGIQEMARRHVELAMEGTEVHHLPIKTLSARLHEDPTGVIAEMEGLSAVALLRLAKTVMPSLSLAVEMERTARGAPTTIVEERSTVEGVEAHAVVEIPHDAERLYQVAAILKAAGALDFGPEDDAEAPGEGEQVPVAASSR